MCHSSDSSTIALPLIVLLAALTGCSGSGSSAAPSGPSTPQIVATVPLGKNPSLIAVNSVSNRIYVVNQADHPPDLSVLDGATNTVLQSVQLSGSPCSLIVNPVSDKIYVGSTGDQTITVIDGTTNNMTTITAGTSPCSLAVDTSANKIYAGNSGSNTVTVIDGVTNATLDLSVQGSPVAIAINPNTNRIYVVNQIYPGIQNVSVIDGATNQIIKVLDLPTGDATSIVTDVATNQVYLLFFAYHADGVLAIDGSTFAINPIYTADQTHNLSGIFAINSTTNKIYVPALSGPLPVVVAIDIATNIATDIQSGQSGNGIVIDEVSNQIYVSGSASGVSGIATIIDGALNTTSSLTVGINPGPIGLNSANHRVYVVNQCGKQPNCSTDNPALGTVTVIQGGG